MISITPADLLTSGGAIAAVLLVIQFLVKPYFKAHPVSETAYPLVLNICALVIALLVETLGLFVVDNITRQTIAQAILLAFFSAASAVGLYEAQNNTKIAARSK